MDTNNIKKDKGYYRHRLQERLHARFPEKAHDRKFIAERSSWAAEAYECAARSGNLAEQCDYIADYLLFEGLHFSRFGLVREIVGQDFDTLLAEQELHAFSLQLLARFTAVFDTYELSEGFEGTPGHAMLWQELREKITAFADAHFFP